VKASDVERIETARLGRATFELACDKTWGGGGSAPVERALARAGQRRLGELLAARGVHVSEGVEGAAVARSCGAPEGA
jgi:hypothetical protein